jgi:hypothetical protein
MYFVYLLKFCATFKIKSIPILSSIVIHDTFAFQNLTHLSSPMSTVGRERSIIDRLFLQREVLTARKSDGHRSEPFLEIDVEIIRLILLVADNPTGNL